jgi:hypothetical protein
MINGDKVTLLTIGHLAHALGRTNWTVHYWEGLGLLPPAPFVINPEDLRTRRRLYPEPYVDALAEIARRLGIGGRMNRGLWMSFYQDARVAYEVTVLPLIHGVVPPVVITVDQMTGARVTTICTGEVAAISTLSLATAS